jgi:hypothetical protein
MVAALQIAHATAKTLDLFVLSASHPTGIEMAANPAKLTVRDVQAVLDRLGKNARQLPGQEVQDIHHDKHAKRNPCTRAGLGRDWDRLRR